MLGHSSIKITQEYFGKIVKKRVSEKMERISGKPGERFSKQPMLCLCLYPLPLNKIMYSSLECN
jgi:hypothetical protein